MPLKETTKEERMKVMYSLVKRHPKYQIETEKKSKVSLIQVSNTTHILEVKEKRIIGFVHGKAKVVTTC